MDELSNLNNLGGMSITIPFKRSYYERKDEFQRSTLKYEGNFAHRAKIINTIVKLDSFLYQGYNTDLFGIEKTLSPVSEMKNVVILGAGATS